MGQRFRASRCRVDRTRFHRFALFREARPPTNPEILSRLPPPPQCFIARHKLRRVLSGPRQRIRRTEVMQFLAGPKLLGKSRNGNVAFRIKSMFGGLNRPLLPPSYRPAPSGCSLSSFSPVRKTHRRKTYAGRTPIRGRRLHEHEWSEGEDGTGSTTSGPGLSGAAGSRGRLHPGVPAAPGRG